jgi:hypothetical protein
MSLPENLTYVTVTGTLADGTDRRAVFRTPSWLIGDPIVPPFGISATIQEDGTFSVELPATDDPAWEPVDWTYDVLLQVDGQALTGSLAVPHDTVGSLSLAAVMNTDVPADAAQVTYILASARGAALGVAALDADGDVTDSDGRKILDLYGDRLTAGETTLSRDQGMSEVGLDLGTLHLSYFTATRTETITDVVTALLTNVASSNTLARVGIWSVDANGGLTALLASSANDTTLWETGNGLRTANLSGNFAKVAGIRYAIGALVVGGTAPQLIGVFPSASMGSLAPRSNGAVTGLSDLPASVAAASIADDSRRQERP